MRKLSYMLGMVQMNLNSTSTSQVGQEFIWAPECGLSQQQLVLASKTLSSVDETETEL